MDRQAIIARLREHKTAPQATFDAAEQTRLLAAAHSIIVDQAPWLFIVHDLNLRAMTKKVQGYVPAQSWFVDFTWISVV